MKLADLLRPEGWDFQNGVAANPTNPANPSAKFATFTGFAGGEVSKTRADPDAATEHRAWRIGHEGVAKDGTPAMAWIESTFSPPATMAQLRSWYPDAAAFEQLADDRTPPREATGDDDLDWAAMVEDVRRHLLGHGVEIGPALGRMTADELADWRAGWFGPDEIRAFAGVGEANRLADEGRLLVRCADCRHFERTDHPHLGDCARHELPPGAAGFWGDDLRACERFDPYQGHGVR